MTPEKPQAQASSSLTTPMSTLRCLKMRLPVSRVSRSSQTFRNGSQKASMSSISLRRQILVDAARAEIGRVHARAAGPLVEHHQLLALLEAPERRRQRADVHRLRRDVEQMREEPADLAVEHADELGAARDRRCRAGARPRAHRRAPGSSARHSRADRDRARSAGRCAPPSASRCRDAGGRYADRRARRLRRRARARAAKRRAPPDAAVRS